MIRRAALAVVMVVVALLLTPTAAHAIDINPLPDCKGDPPPAQRPGNGIAGFFIDAPERMPSGDAFVDGAPQFSHYGLAGFEFTTYDLGCGPDIARNPDGTIGTMIAGWMFETSKFIVAATHAVLDSAYNPARYMGVFDDLLVTGVGTLEASIFNEWAPLSIVIIGVLLIFLARRASWAYAVASATWALLVLMIATLVFSYPVRVGEIADGTVASTLGAVNDGINGGSTGDAADAAATSLSNAALWEEWKIGTFGSGNSETADKYAEDLFRAQSFTWEEAAEVAGDPDAARDASEAKAEEWREVAEQIQEEDPDAYQYLTGRNGKTRIAAAIVSGVAVMTTAPFLLVGALMLIGSYLIVRLAVLFLPLIAVVALPYRFRGALLALGNVVAAAILNSFLFGTAALLTVLAIRILVSPDSGIPLWLALVLMLVLSVVMWLMTKPMRRLTTKVSPKQLVRDGANAVGDTARNARQGASSLVKTGVGAAIGGAAGAATVNALDDDKDKAPERSESKSTTTMTPTPPTPSDAAAGPRALPAPAPTAGGSPPAPAADAQAPATSPDAPTPPGGPSTGPTPTSAPRWKDETVAPTIFVPGAEAPPTQEPRPMPRPADLVIDDETGEAVHKIFNPDTEDSR